MIMHKADKQIIPEHLVFLKEANCNPSRYSQLEMYIRIKPVWENIVQADSILISIQSKVSLFSTPFCFKSWKGQSAELPGRVEMAFSAGRRRGRSNGHYPGWGGMARWQAGRRPFITTFHHFLAMEWTKCSAYCNSQLNLQNGYKYSNMSSNHEP